MRVFKVLDDKSVVKADSSLFWTLFLARFPYNYLGQNESF